MSSSRNELPRRRGGRAGQKHERPLWERFRQQVPRRTFVSHLNHKFEYYDAIPNSNDLPRTKRVSASAGDQDQQKDGIGKQKSEIKRLGIDFDRGRGKSRMETAKDEETLIIVPDLFGTAAVFYKQVMALSAQASPPNVKCCSRFP